MGLSIGGLIKPDLPPFGSFELADLDGAYIWGKPCVVKSGSWDTENLFLRITGFSPYDPPLRPPEVNFISCRLSLLLALTRSSLRLG